MYMYMYINNVVWRLIRKIVERLIRRVARIIERGEIIYSKL